MLRTLRQRDPFTIICSICGVVSVLSLLAAGIFAILGDEPNALRAGLSAFAIPGAILMSAWTIGIVREKNWYRHWQMLLLLLFPLGGALFSISLVAWLPWIGPVPVAAPDMPALIQLPMFGGIVTMALGLAGTSLVQFIWTRRRR